MWRGSISSQRLARRPDAPLFRVRFSSNYGLTMIENIWSECCIFVPAEQYIAPKEFRAIDKKGT